MERTVSELMSQQGPTPHMGQLRCLMERRGLHSLKGYKKRFWVVDERNGRLEVYKNDQEHVPIQVFRAADIRNVIYADDKQNRFFVMMVQTRGPRDIKFRMSSFEERESWSKAITHIMDVYSAINKHKNVLGMVLRRAKTVSDALGVNISIDSGRLLAEVPEDLLQYVAEAVDIALASVTSIARSFSEVEVDMPRSYILYVHAITEEQSPQQPKETKYNPEGRTMTMNVCLLRVKSERVSFSVTQPEEVFRLVQSNVFRNPLIEGWIESEPNCARACADIQDYLGLPAARRSWITFQWGQHLSDSAKVEAFLQRFVTVTFFKRALRSVRDAVVRVERLIADTNAQATTKSFMGGTAAVSTRDGGGSSPFSVWRPVMTTGVTVQPDSAFFFGNNGTSAATVTGGLSGAAANGNGGGGFQSNQASFAVVTNSAAGVGSDAALAIRLIRENVAGLCIQLDKRVVEKATVPPPIVTLHASEYEQHCQPAFLLVTKCRRVLPLKHRVTGDVLSDELYEVGYNAFLQQQLSLLRIELNGIFYKQVRVVVMWDPLFRAAAALKTPISIEELPHLLRHVKDVCLSRLQHVVQVLRNAHTDVPGHVEDHNYLYNAFCSCVGTVVVNFLPYTVRSDASVVEPKLQAGVLTDTLYCTKEESMPSLMAVLGHVHRGGNTKTTRASLLGTGSHSVVLYAAEAKLGAWCENYFSNPKHAIPDPRIQLVEDEFDSDTDGTSVGMLQDSDFGEAVAYERSAEIGLLTMQRVVNVIYDSQCQAPVDLKIGCDDIMRAIHAFVSSFGDGKRPRKHDVARVLIINLQRLRQMYVRAVDDETTSLLTFEQARQLLRDFCEYKTNEQYIDVALREISKLGIEPLSPLVEQESKRRSESHQPVEAAEEAIDIYATDSGGRLTGSNAYEYSPNTRGPNEVNFSVVSSSTAIEAEMARRGNRRSLSRRRFQSNGNRVSTTAPSRSRESPSAVTEGPMSDRSGLNIRLPSSASDAFDFASVTEVALMELLPREARLARLALRVGFVFGLENTGKSLIINSMRGIASPTVATVGLSQQVVAFDEWVWALNELGGRESFRKNWRYYALRIETVHFLVFVLDILNVQALSEAQQYLKEVTKYYHDAPLLVIFNNFREGHRHFDIAEFESLIDLDKLRRRHGSEVFSCVCDITVVHSKNRQLPPKLRTTLRSLASLLMARSKDEDGGDGGPPPVPKVMTTSISESVAGGAAGAAAAGAGVGLSR
ncbi:PH domain/ADP-ribosylation factor family, putative [Leishmania lindenbergi]|uniref:PH domain/ADP-ribosylation factor family n=1 Tax=Leishmania lindenbergi TaxID=651832 RepID=A0AAW2ZRH9_9TRYP